MNKRGLKCLFYPLFGQKLAEFVLFLKTIIYSQLNAREARRKILNMGGDQWLDGGGLRIFLMCEFFHWKTIFGGSLHAAYSPLRHFLLVSLVHNFGSHGSILSFFPYFLQIIFMHALVAVFTYSRGIICCCCFKQQVF